MAAQHQQIVRAVFDRVAHGAAAGLMNIRSDELLALAREVFEAPDAGERHWRCAAGAAYYALYHEVVAVVNYDPAKSAGGSHAVVRQALFSLPIAASPFVVSAKAHWNKLLDRRVAADYHVKADFTKTNAQWAVETVEFIFSKKEN
ncbi:MAG: hypothetical protein EXQ92_10840 [Alphaproteobacteria bacterium]|nr:hypothetical protein [Alphaproteobacteria bacterium]